MGAPARHCDCGGLSNNESERSMELTVDRVGAKSRVSSPVASLDRRRIVAVRAASPACEKPSWLVPCAAGSGFAYKHSQRFTESGFRTVKHGLNMTNNASCMNKKQQHSKAQRVLENWTKQTLGYRYGLPDGEGEGEEAKARLRLHVRGRGSASGFVSFPQGSHLQSSPWI